MALSDPKKNTKPKFKAVINKLPASVFDRHDHNKMTVTRQTFSLFFDTY